VRNRVSLMALSVAAGLGVAGVGIAPPASAQQGQTQSISIPSQPLSAALLALAEQTGLEILFDTRLVEGLAAPAVQGNYTPEQALQRLLAGTDLRYRFSNGDTVTLAGADTQDGDGPMQLGPIMVEGWRTTATRGYRPDLISSATKTDSAIVDVPVAVSVVTEDVIADQNARSVREALRNVPGVEAGPNAANVSVQEEFTIRGFENSFVNVNGVERRSTGPLSVANIESIEVIKGPSSVLTGQVAPGGFINIQTKRPQREAAYEASGTLFQSTTGRGTIGRGVVDATGPLTEDGSLLYRFIASADGGSSFIDKVESEQYLANGMLSFLGLGGDLRVDLDFSYLRNDETFLFGIPFRNGKPDTRIGRTTFLATDDNEKVTEDFNAEIRAEYAVTDATTVDAAFAYHLNDHLTRAQRSFPDDEVQPDNTFGSSLDNLDQESHDINFEANVIHNLSLGSTDWRLLAGGEVRRSVFKDNELFFANDEPRINVLNPTNDARLPLETDPDLFVLPPGKNTTDSVGLYGQGEVWIHDRVKLLGGLRYEYVEFDAGRFGNSSTQTDDKVTPRIGVLGKVTPTTSLYGSYSRSFQQQSGTDASGNALEPTEGEQWEVGIKQEFLDGGVLATLAGFHISQSNLPVTDPDSLVGNVQIGEVESQGVEFEIKGQVTDRLRLTAGYSFIDNEITTDPLGNQGNRLGNVPKHQASAFALYDVLRTDEERLTVGGGVFYTGSRFTDETNRAELDDFVTIDLTAQYAFQWSGMEMEVQASVRNLLDEEFFEQGASRVAFRGEPRTVFTALKMRF